jgi:putative peptide zinc metalloprotease protein
VAVACAGVYVEWLLGACAWWVWWWTRPGALHDFCLHTIVVTSISTWLINLNPLARYDGYYVLSDWWRCPNLSATARQHAVDWLRSWFHRPVSDVADAGRPNLLLAAYSAASAGYVLFITLGIAGGLWWLLRSWSLTPLVWVYLTVAVAMIGWRSARFASAVIRRHDGERPLRFRQLAGLVAVIGLCYAAATVRISLPSRAPFVVEASGGEPLFVSVGGKLAEIAVSPGYRVEPGQLLVRLRDPELECRRWELLAQCARQQQQIEMLAALDQHAERTVAEEALERLADQLQHVEQQLERLSIVAPMGGEVVPVAEVPEPPESGDDLTPRSWLGTPLDARNLGAWLASGTPLLTIAPTTQRRAEVYVSQSQRAELSPQSVVRLRWDGRPREFVEAKVDNPVDRTVDTAPATLLVANGGPLATVRRDQRETLAEGYFIAAAEISTAEPWPIGARGRAWYWRPPRTVWEHLQRAWNATVVKWR